MQRLLSPTNDWMFKQLFGTEKRKDLTIHLINALLEGTQPHVVDVTFLKAVLDKETVVLRPSIVDVLCRAEDGRQFIVEMQRAYDTHFIQRLVEYTCQVYLNQRRKEIKEPGDRGGYGKMYPVICLAIMEASVFKTKKAYLSHHEFRDIVTQEQDIKELSFTFLELSKFQKKFEELETDVERWAYFFRNATDTPPELWEQILEENNVFTQAYQALSQAAYTPEQFLTYLGYEQKEAEILIQNDEAREKGRVVGIKVGLAEGLAQGREEGLAEGAATEKRQLAMKLLQRGMSLEDVVEITGLSALDLQMLTQS